MFFSAISATRHGITPRWAVARHARDSRAAITIDCCYSLASLFGRLCSHPLSEPKHVSPLLMSPSNEATVLTTYQGHCPP